MHTLKQQNSQSKYRTGLITAHPATFQPANSERLLPTKKRDLSNQLVQRFTKSCPQMLPRPSMCLFGGACHTCAALVQAKLTVNEPGDKYEQEADRVADQVMRMPEPRVQRVCTGCDKEETTQTNPLAKQITPLVQRQEVEPEEEEKEPIQTKLAAEVQRQEVESDKEEETIQAKAALDRTPMVTPKMHAQIYALRGGGRPLLKSTRAFFEPRFGRKFSQVRIYTGEQAAIMTRAVNARAFTLGDNIAFGAGQYTPHTAVGKKLLAHELVHVLQQENKPAWSIQRSEEERYIPTSKSLSSVGYAYSLMRRNIWFDSWGNDLRDNNLDGNIDNSSEQGFADGSHYHGGARAYTAKVCPLVFLRTDQCPRFTQQSIDVYYKVCIDVPKEAYAAAGISMPSTRRIRNIIPWFRNSSSFQTWTKPSLPTVMVPGDFIAVQSGGHSHSGIVPGFGLPRPWLVDAIHLPGPTSRRSLGGQFTYWPSSTNDVFRTPWPFDIDFVARPII